MGDNCEACRTNTDPRKVPVHPNCNCEVITQSVETGVDVEAWQPIEQWVRENGQLRFIQGNLGQSAEAGVAPAVDMGDDLLNITMEALTFDPSTVTVLEIEDARWSDVERWLETVNPLLMTGNYAVTFLEDPGEAAEQTQEVIELSENLLTFTEKIQNVHNVLGKRLFMTLTKWVEH